VPALDHELKSDLLAGLSREELDAIGGADEED